MNEAPRPTCRDRRLVRLCRDSATLVATLTRFWLIVHPLVRQQLEAWEHRASQIPDPQLREQALATLRSERLSAAGAAMFAATTRRPRPELIEALVSFQVTWDYLDTLSEQPVEDSVRNGAQLHQALVDAVSGERSDDYYRYHPTAADGGYLRSLVGFCGERCHRLPAYAQVRAAAVRETSRVTVQGINHAPAAVREPLLRRWARCQEGAGDELAWFELAAAASSSMAILAILASAAEPLTTECSAERTRVAYFPWVDALTTLLDSHVDADADALEDQLSFVAHYPSAQIAAERLVAVCERAFAAARSLPSAERHVVLIAGMMALHLSHASAWSPRASATTRAVIAASNTGLILLLLPLLRAWRIVQDQDNRFRFKTPHVAD